MDIENINATPIRNTKMYSKINKLFLRHLKEKGIIDIIFFYAMNNKELNYICKHVSLTEEWIYNNKDNLSDMNWKFICENQHMTINFIKKQKYYINWERLFEKNKFIRNYPDYCTLYETYYFTNKKMKFFYYLINSN